MKKTKTLLILFALVCEFMGSTQVEAASRVTVKTYKNCAEINKVFPGGIARSGY